MKNYIGISRDHSGSMAVHTNSAMKDYNEVIAGIKEAAAGDVDTIVSVVKCGVNQRSFRFGVAHSAPSIVERDVVNSSVSMLQPLSFYEATGQCTPLFDSVGELIELLEDTPDKDNLEVSYLVMAITDGLENCSSKWGSARDPKKLRDKIMELQATDRWTVTFRVPKGYASQLARLLGIPEGNILEWEQTKKGFETATATTRTAVTSYYTQLRSGVRSTQRFYSNIAHIPTTQLKRELQDISKDVEIFSVDGAQERVEIRPFCEVKTGRPYHTGFAFYQVVKPETVQSHKEVAILDKKTGSVYSGQNARDLLGLPQYGSVRLHPGHHGGYELFIQSTSVNRLLPRGSKVLYLKH